jgi:hypothetical protein
MKLPAFWSPGTRSQAESILKSPALTRTARVIRDSIAIQDCIFLGTVMLVSLISYINALGFYSDDWSYLDTFNASHNPRELLASFFPSEAYRPLLVLPLVALFYIFGLQPLGYHIVESAMLFAVVLLLYAILRELSLPRLVTLAVPLTYALLPHYSTDRFWVSVSCANLSMLLCFISFYAALRTTVSWSMGWMTISLAALMLSTLAYEVTIPLFIVIPPLMWYRASTFSSRVTLNQAVSHRFRIGIALTPVIALVIAMVYKLATQQRTKFQGRFLHQLGTVCWHAIVLAFNFNYGRYGLLLPRVAWRALNRYFNWPILLVCVFLGILIYWYLLRVGRDAAWPPAAAWLLLAASGLVIYGLAFSPFTADVTLDWITAGVANRTAIAAALGPALSLVGLMGWVGTLLHSQRIRGCWFAVTISIFCFSGCTIINTIASFWAKASKTQAEILTSIRSQFPVLEPESTIILDGACAYIGPGIVFEGDLDLEPALRLMYRDRTLQANIVTAKTRIDEDGLWTSLYDFKVRYSYSPKLIVYNYLRRIAAPLKDVHAARRYFQKYDPDFTSGCPPSQEAYGAPIFD